MSVRTETPASVLLMPILLPVLCCLGAAACAAPDTDEPSAVRESIHDSVVFIEPSLITQIPAVARWCDRLEHLSQRRIDVGDAELYVEEEGEGVPLVLINGGPGGTHHYFHPWFSRATDFARVIYYDQRGCGLSDRAPGAEGYSVDQAVADLDALREGLGLERWAVLGYSYGGFLAQYYALRHPERVSGLVLVGASPGMWTGTGSSRQGEFISEAERQRMREIRQQLDSLREVTGMSRAEFISLLIYNNFLNGDWKRQSYYRPTRDRLAEVALYEWDHDQGFNSVMSESQDRVDLTGAFAGSPLPTLIMEGAWDLTWGEQKPLILAGNHPNAELVQFDQAGHGIYDEDPDRFFTVLERFLTSLPPVPEADMEAFRRHVATCDAAREAAPAYVLRGYGWDRGSSDSIAARYRATWPDSLSESRDFMRLGFALYDVEDYQAALYVFERMQARFAGAEEREERFVAFALIWEGHMLDLLGRRDEALIRYAAVMEMDVDDGWQHGQYGLQYDLVPWARERLETPFERVENQSAD